MYYMCTKFEVITQTQRTVKVMNTHFYNFWHRNHSDSDHSNQDINFCKLIRILYVMCDMCAKFEIISLRNVKVMNTQT